MKKALFISLLSLTLLCATVIPMTAADSDIVIYYTNDVHTYIANHIEGDTPDALTYSKIAALKAADNDALLVDAGDHVQGTVYGKNDEGATIIKLMNAAGYDLATLGNHEFDYGMERLFENIAAADFEYISCNFHSIVNGERGETLLSPYTVKEVGGKRIAFVGISTPETLSTSIPVFFKNEADEYIYGFDGMNDPADLYTSVQNAIDAARAEGVDYVIGLGHLGVDDISGGLRSISVIENTAGFDAFIDAHSHTTMVGEYVADKNGKEILVTQTGYYLETIGRMTIKADGTVTTEMLSEEEIASLVPVEEVKAIEDAHISGINDMLGEVIGYSEVTFDNYDADGTRLVRRQSTNSGDLAADAYYHYFIELGYEVDGAMINGGGIRNGAVDGEITYRECSGILPFEDKLCLLRVTGQQLLDALELCVAKLSPDGSTEDGGLFHVSGIRYTVDLSIPSTVTLSEDGMWISGPTGEYRVRDVMLYDKETAAWKELDTEEYYNIAGRRYIMRQDGCGCTMFREAECIVDYGIEDNLALAAYVMSFEIDETTGLPTIKKGDGYDSIYGSGRISILPYAPSETAEAPDAAESEEITEEIPEDSIVHIVVYGDTLWDLAAYYLGSGLRWSDIFEANADVIDDPNLIFVGDELTVPGNGAN